MSLKPEFSPKPIRSFVLRTGRMTEGQTNAFDRHWDTYGLELKQPIPLAEAFPHSQPLVVEIGFGMGDSLVAMAAADPGRNFIGVEVHPPGVGRLLTLAADAELTNLRVYMADAVDVFRTAIAPQSVARIQVFFPDPWPKKRHHKRRLIQPQFVQLLTHALQPGGILHCATDWQPYADHMLEVLQGEPALCNTCEGFAERPDYRPKTKFEMRGEALGHQVFDLLFSKR